MSTVQLMKNIPPVYVPAAASTLAGFRAWAASDQFPDQGRVTYIDHGLLINALGDEVDFQLLQHRPLRYELAPAQDGWHRSDVFGRAFKLERRRHRLGLWKYTLHVQERLA